jgi:RNA polymerase sigma-70 factor (ECF subfamily)
VVHDDPPLAAAAEVDGYLTGQPRAFEEVDRWIRGELRNRYPRLRDELDDLSQTVHEKLLVNLREGRFRGQSTLRTYVTSIVNYTAIDRLREIYRQRAFSETWSAEAPLFENPYASPPVEDERKLLHQLVAALPERCRELWQLIFLEKLRDDEIARRLSIPAGTVKSRMWHCRRKAMAALRRLRLVR